MDKVLELNQILNEEIKFCEGFEQLLVDKKEVLIHSKAMQLKDYDEKIYQAHDKLNELKAARIEIIKKFGKEHSTLTELITTIQDKAMARELELKRQKLQNFVIKITAINKIINSLIEHSLKMIEGNIGAIAKATKDSQTKNDYYNNMGNKQQQEIHTLSAIIREA